MKLVYRFSRRRFGTVVTPIAVFSARMPVAFGTFYGKVAKLDKKLTLPAPTALLIRDQVARTNGCLFCMDVSRYFAMTEAPDNLPRVDALWEYRTSPLVTDAERAALDYATELTRTREVSPDTFARLASFYSEREICDIVWLVASEHLYNLSNLALGIGSDGLCELRLQRKPTASTSSNASTRTVSGVSR
jgi:alkylhydroperoxidase family enzyme